jgi:hypothetical protein
VSSDWKTGDFQDSRSKGGDGSLSFNLKEKYAKDFATGETAGDIISIYAKRFCDGNQKKAYDELVERYHLKELVEPKRAANVDESSSVYKSNNIAKYSTDETLTEDKIKKNDKVRFILSNSKPYKEGDAVDLYLKSRGITKRSDECLIYEYKEVISMVNVCKNKIGIPVGLQQTFLTKDGKKLKKEGMNTKIQRVFANETISGNPVILKSRGKNNGIIYITEGIENGLSIQEYINNEVWCSLSVQRGGGFEKRIILVV